MTSTTQYDAVVIGAGQSGGPLSTALARAGWKTALIERLAGDFELVLVNASHMKRVPGRKTDVQDAEWRTSLLQYGLLTPSFVPDQAQQDVRDLTRLRMHLLQDRSQLVNRIHKVLQQGGIKLSGVLSNILGVVFTSHCPSVVCWRKRSRTAGWPGASERRPPT